MTKSTIKLDHAHKRMGMRIGRFVSISFTIVLVALAMSTSTVLVHAFGMSKSAKLSSIRAFDPGQSSQAPGDPTDDQDSGGLVISERPLAVNDPEEPPVSAQNLSGNAFYVSPGGKDTNSGRTPDSPFLTIQHSLELASPGDVITLAPGDYMQDVVSVRDGKPDAPITVTGPSTAVIRGAGKGRIFEITNSFLVLTGFSIDGLWGDPTKVTGYRDKLLYVQGTQPFAGVKGLKIDHLSLRNAGGECLRLRYFARNNEIAFNSIGPCGVQDFKFPSKSKNGEGIYLGTSSNQWADGKNPTSGPDLSTNNWIHDNVIDTEGNECVDIKEGAFSNLVENNSCTGQKDPDSGGFDARGDANVFRNNKVFGNLGVAFRIGGHRLCVDASGAVVSDMDAPGAICPASNRLVTYGQNTQVYGNSIHDNKVAAFKILQGPQAQICANVMSNNGKNGKAVIGSAAAPIHPTDPC
jgi:hypothetical protein